MRLPADGTDSPGSPDSPDSPDSDARLIERFKRGDREAFDGIVLRYRKDVYRIAYRMTANHEDADDVAQETFVRAYRALGSFRGEASLKTWLFRIAMNLSVNVGRQRQASRTEDRDLDRLPEPGAASGPLSERRLLESEAAQRVRAAVGGLPPRQKQVVLLRIYEEMPFQQIADVLDCPIGTAKANFFHAMNNLRKAFA